MNATSNLSFLVKILLPFLAVITIWLLSGNDDEQKKVQESSNLNKASDYAMTDFTMTVMSQEGTPTRVISGKEMAHYPDGDSTEVIEPSVQFIEPKKETWLISASKASTQGRGEDILLLGNVIITQQNNPDIELRTEKLNLDTLHHTAYTDLAVSMKSPAGMTNSVGLHASLKEKTINLHSRVKGHYDAPSTQ